MQRQSFEHRLAGLARRVALAFSGANRDQHALDALRPERRRAVETGVQVWRRRRWYVL